MTRTCLHHYTKKEGLEGIISNNSLHLTHYRYLNDPSELDFGIDQVEKYISEVLKKQGKDEQNVVYDKYNALVSSLMNAYKNQENRPWNPYVISFCQVEGKDRDDGLLSMWRAYSQNQSMGYALEFNKENLENYIESDLEKKGFPYVLYHKILYLYPDENTTEEISKLIIYILNNLPKEGKSKLGITESQDNDGIIKQFNESLVEDLRKLHNKEKAEYLALCIIFTLAIFIKYKGYQEEREYRVCIGFPNVYDRDKYEDIIKYLKTDKKSARSDKTPYLLIESPQILDCIERIIIGPSKHDQSIMANDVNELLFNRRLDINIKTIISRIPHW